MVFVGSACLAVWWFIWSIWISFGVAGCLGCYLLVSYVAVFVLVLELLLGVCLRFAGFVCGMLLLLRMFGLCFGFYWCF